MARSAWLIAAAVVATIGCKGTTRRDLTDAAPPDRPSLAVPLGGGPMSVAGALNVLANARCQREDACGRVGKGRTFRDLTTCERTELQTHAQDVNILQCKAGVDGKRLESCASKLASRACEGEDVAASEVCGTGRICLGE